MEDRIKHLGPLDREDALTRFRQAGVEAEWHDEQSDAIPGLMVRLADDQAIVVNGTEDGLRFELIEKEVTPLQTA